MLRLGLIGWLVYPGCNGAETLYNILVRPFIVELGRGQGKGGEAEGGEVESLLGLGAEGGTGGGGGGSSGQSAGLAAKVRRLSPEAQEALNRIVLHLDSDETVNMLFQVRPSCSTVHVLSVCTVLHNPVRCAIVSS